MMLNFFQTMILSEKRLQVNWSLRKNVRIDNSRQEVNRQLDDIYSNTSFYFEKIDNIIKNDNEENASVKDVLMDLWCDNIICRIRRKINDQNLGILDSSIKLNESDCNEVKQKIDRVIELKWIYEKSKSKAVNEKRVLNSVDQGWRI